MKTSTFKLRLLEVITPHFIKVYSEHFIPSFSDVSKPAFKTVIENPDKNPFLKEDWGYLYLNEIKLYGNGLKSFESIRQMVDSSHLDKKDIDETVANIFLESFRELSEGFSFEDNIFSDIGNDLNNSEERLFVQISIAQFYNSLSIIQNNKRINELLTDFLNNGKDRNLIKAVKVDPSVLKLREIQAKLDDFDPIKRSKIEIKIHTAKSIPALTPDKRKKYILLSIFLDIASRLGYLNSKYPISNKMLQSLAENLNIISESFDPDDFKKFVTYYRKI